LSPVGDLKHALDISSAIGFVFHRISVFPNIDPKKWYQTLKGNTYNPLLLRSKC
jgi:hypothetical protein